MKIVKTASGKQTIKMSKSEWQSIGKTAGWVEDRLDLPIHEDEKIEEVEKVEEVETNDDRPFTAEGLRRSAFIKGFLPFSMIMEAETENAAQEISDHYADIYRGSAQGFGTSDMNAACRELLSSLGLAEPTEEEFENNRKVADQAFKMFN